MYDLRSFGGVLEWSYAVLSFERMYLSQGTHKYDLRRTIFEFELIKIDKTVSRDACA